MTKTPEELIERIAVALERLSEGPVDGAAARPTGLEAVSMALTKIADAIELVAEKMGGG